MDMEMEAKREAAQQYQKNKAKKEKKQEPEKKSRGPEFRFTIDLNAKDYWLFSLHHSNSGFLGIFNLLFTLVSLFVLVIRWSSLTVPYRLLLVVCVLMFTVWQPMLLYRKASRQAKVMASKPPMKLTFSDEGLLVKQEGQKVEFTWDQMGRMDQGIKMVVLYMDRVHAYLIPDRAMGDQKEAFYEMARRHLPKTRRRRL